MLMRLHPSATTLFFLSDGMTLIKEIPSILFTLLTSLSYRAQYGFRLFQGMCYRFYVVSAYELGKVLEFISLRISAFDIFVPI